MEEKGLHVNRCLKNPIIVYESTSRDIPKNLRELLKQFDEDSLNQNDHLVILAYTMMVEMGFIPYHKIRTFSGIVRSPTFDIKFLSSGVTIPSNWKDGNGRYVLSFALPSLPNHEVFLTAQSSGSIVVFTVWLKSIETTPSWCIALDSGKYVMRSKTEFMNHRYFNLKELSQKFKNEIPLPVRSFLKFHGYVEDNCFMDLPWEMKVSICRFISDRDICRLSKTCSQLRNLPRSRKISNKGGFLFCRAPKVL